MNDPNLTADFPGHEIAESQTDSAPLPERIGRYRVESLLGRGGFGIVYLAYDEQLQRSVAIKVPHRHRVSTPEEAKAYLIEARTVANLDHPNIVPVHDVGSTDEFPCYVVSKYIDGTNLFTRLKQSRPSIKESVELVATVAEALHHAHKQGLVHRDIKPGNLLLEKTGKPFVADFGLALREQDVGKGPRYAGTPAYMSPEQARGEGHRVDGRSDIFSLGVVFYELLVGRRPFKADSHEELLEQITSVEVRPPRQVDDSIPKELERICLKSLSKRASERYTTAKDFADDLRHLFATATDAEKSCLSVKSATNTEAAPSSVPTPTTSPASGSQPIKIVPKGLRSFDAHDADFFLELLPGPRDRDGLPDSIRFWKTRIDEKDADNTFTVGLIYGPSGCGKSSLVKAGLLPRLSEDVIAVYVEATAEETEARLLNGLRKRCPGLPDNLNLKETLAGLRRGQSIPVAKKVVIVLDQFEQWLHAKKEEQNTELVQALRQCDGGRVQCIVMVRDDFWLAVSRFLRQLEVRLVEGHNSAVADLFDLHHAKKVLAAFGRAFGKLPENLGDTTKDKKEFLAHAVAGLAQEGKVISVRLALFAEMMKGKSWTPATLKEVGGTEGVGVTFLEETFSAATAPPEHRYHQNAARGVLKALLPESGTDIKGHMRSHGELLEASGYGNRLKDFDDLIRILDNEIRLITPTDPEGKDANSDSILQAKPGRKYYQLTHDYLVHSLREWLTRKQKETRRGRAELLLADRAGVWNARQENRQLPSLLQWIQIRTWTKKKNWTPPQKKLMDRAIRYHIMRGIVMTACVILLGFVGLVGYGRLKARNLLDRLVEASTPDVPNIVKEMAPYRRWLDPLLHEAAAQAEIESDPRKRLHVSLALLPAEPRQVEYLYGRLLKAQPQEFIVIQEALFYHKQVLSGRLWVLLENSKNDQDQRLRAACVLATFAPDDARWENVSSDVAATLVIQKPFVISQWTHALKGARRWLIPVLADFLVDEKRSVIERGSIAGIYAIYAADMPDAFTSLEKQLAEEIASDASLDAKIAFAKRQASVGVALLIMDHGEKVWPLLKHQPDPTLRTFLIERLALGGVEFKVLVARLNDETETSIKRALLLSLGEFRLDHLSQAERQKIWPRVLDLYRTHPDPGIHGAAEWLLRRWQGAGELKEIDKGLATGKVEGKRQWFVTRQGQTMVVIADSPREFWMGKGKQKTKRRLSGSFAIGSKDVTWEQFQRFRKTPIEYQALFGSPIADCPVSFVSWYEAAAYCNWLSKQEGIPESQWCYEPNKTGVYAKGMKLATDWQTRAGYRLPSEDEWEFACRAGSETEWSWGEAEEVTGAYAWFSLNSQIRTHSVASLRPNDLGLFDMHGNVWQWCQDGIEADKDRPKIASFLDDVDGLPNRILRGGSYVNSALTVHCAVRNTHVRVSERNQFYGFRVARTLTP